MRNILSLFLTINIVVGTSVAPVAYADGSASEHYEKYVNKMIPLSFDLARQDAILRESALIFQRISEIQEHLTIGTEHTLKIEALAPLISRYAVNSCNSQIIEDNVWNNYQNLLFNLSQIKNTLKSYDENKSKLNALFNSFPTACNSDFSKYTTSLLPSSFQKTTIEAEDGV